MKGCNPHGQFCCYPFYRGECGGPQRGSQDSGLLTAKPHSLEQSSLTGRVEGEWSLPLSPSTLLRHASSCTPL